MKWKVCIFIVVFGLTEVYGSPQPPRSGRKLRLRNYEIQFGSWPLMEVTKLSRRPPPPKFKALGGFMQNAIQVNANGKIPPGFKFGPPPPPKSALFKLRSRFRSRRRNRPSPKPLDLTSFDNTQQFSSFQQTLPFSIQNGQTTLNDLASLASLPTSSSYTPPTSTSSPFSSVMGNSAYSEFFGNNKPTNKFKPFSFFSKYNKNYPPYRPPSYMPKSSYYAPPPQIFVGEVVPPTQSERFEMDKTPKVPSVIQIGSNPPEGYKLMHGERQLISLKLPDLKMNKMDPFSLMEGAEVIRRGDHFNDRTPSSQNFRKEERKHPDVGALYTVNMVLQTPNISAPMNGRSSPHFQLGMEEMKRIYSNANKKSPLDSQVKLLGKLFTELQTLKPPMVNVESESDTILRRDSTDPFGVEPAKYYVRPKIDAPLLAVHIQSFSVPEPGTGDPDVAESARMFGLQGHRIEFGNTNEIVNLMDTAQKAVTARIPVEELGFTRSEVNHNLQEWIKGYVSLTRKMKDQAHLKGEEIANKSFKQHQYQMRMSDNSMQPMDPKMFSEAASITNAGAVATYQG